MAEWRLDLMWMNLLSKKMTVSWDVASEVRTASVIRAMNE
jgi:hypothetical protein